MNSVWLGVAGIALLAFFVGLMAHKKQKQN
ncbi:LPXTG cell wall anchor domain-containing protein [Mailhella sp.]